MSNPPLSRLAQLKLKAASTLSISSDETTSTNQMGKVSGEDTKANSNSSLLNINHSPSISVEIDSVLDGSLSEKTSTSIVSISNSDSGSVSFATLEFKSKLAELQSALLSSHPSMPSLLRDIHKQLREDPEQVTLLSDDEIGVIVNGLKKQTQTELSGSVAKKVSSKSAKVSLSVDMF